LQQGLVVLGASELKPQSSNCFVSSFSIEPVVFDVYLFPIFPEQEKASKEQAAKDKAYQDAKRYQQRQEEILGFRKLPAQAPSQCM